MCRIEGSRDCHAPVQRAVLLRGDPRSDGAVVSRTRKTSMAESMGEHEKADEARKGLIDSIKGKAKEIAGAMTGNDSLTAEGQLEQTEARARKEAGVIEAVADAEAESATDLLYQARHQAAGARDVVRSGAEAAEEAAQKQQVTQVQQATQAARCRGAGPCQRRGAARGAPGGDPGNGRHRGRRQGCGRSARRTSRSAGRSRCGASRSPAPT